jgi:hypothetical protein
VSLPFIVNLAVMRLNARPVNSGVRFLLHDLAQSLESTFLNLERQSVACVLVHLEWCEPRADAIDDDSVR